MRLIDADKLKAVLQNIEEHLLESGEPMSVGMAAVFAQVVEIVDMQPTVAPPNPPLTLDELREMVWKQPAVWCSNSSGIRVGLLCIKNDWYTSEQILHICLLDEDRYAVVYSVQSLMQAGATFYRRKPEEETHG